MRVRWRSLYLQGLCKGEKRMYNRARKGVSAMNQKIGAFIAARRRDQGMTQRALAERLGVTDKAVSKWERGICLPDASLYGPLCEVLGTTVEDLFAGEARSQERALDEAVLAVLENSMLRGTALTRADFHRAMRGFVQVKRLLDTFDSREAAIAYLMNETGIDREECAAAYDFTFSRPWA